MKIQVNYHIFILIKIITFSILLGILPGDIHMIIKIENHKEFKRTGADLFMEKKISLLEALTGTNFEIKHLDGKKFKVRIL